MAARTLRPLILTALLALGNFSAAHAEPIPAPTGTLTDYHGLGFIQLDIPTNTGASAAEKTKAVDVPFTTWFPFRQGYVRPDRMLMVMSVAGQVQSMLATGDMERIYSPATGYVVQKSYKNLDPSGRNPMAAAQFSMATYGRILRELTSGKILPDEDLDKLKKELTTRSEEIKKQREALTKAANPDELPKANALAAEHARVHNDIQQIEVRRAHPCHVIEFPNKDLVDSLFAKGLIGDSSISLLLKGKTTVWMTKAEGLPIKIEMTGPDGRSAVYFCFTELKLNQGLHPGELVLGAPQGTRLIAATADLKDKAWEDKMDKELTRQTELYDKERQAASSSSRPRGPKKR